MFKLRAWTDYMYNVHEYVCCMYSILYRSQIQWTVRRTWVQNTYYVMTTYQVILAVAHNAIQQPFYCFKYTLDLSTYHWLFDYYHWSLYDSPALGFISSSHSHITDSIYVWMVSLSFLISFSCTLWGVPNII